MNDSQAGILAPVPKLARYLKFSLKAEAKPRSSLLDLVKVAEGRQIVIGIGQPITLALGENIEGLRSFPTQFGAGLVLASMPAALWCWLRGQGAGMNGSSFVAVQRWIHDFAAFQAMSRKDQDNAIGRRKKDDIELINAPASSHVKRTAQESFDPEAFLLRRSMPWVEGTRGGLNFVAFGKSFDAFEAQLRRMVGAEDGIADALFKFTRPASGSYFWRPPMRRGKLDLRALGL